MSKALLDAALDAAEQIQERATLEVWFYAAAQQSYGVAVHVLCDGGEDWIDWRSAPDGARILFVRLIDCDGEVSEFCETEEEVEAVRDEWLAFGAGGPFDEGWTENDEADGVGWGDAEWDDEDDESADRHYLDYDSYPEDDE